MKKTPESVHSGKEQIVHFQSPLKIQSGEITHRQTPDASRLPRKSKTNCIAKVKAMLEDEVGPNQGE